MRRPQKILIDVDAWDEFVARYFRNRILSITVIEALTWRHPWFTELAWSTIAQQWTARINPGYCLSGAGADPQVSVPENLASDETRERLSIEDPTSLPLDAYLSELPLIPIAAARWRPIGTDAVTQSGSDSEAVPDRFAKRGVMGPVVLDTSGQGGLVTRVSGLVADRRSARLLRACDLVLTHDRVRSVVTPSLLVDSIEVEFSQLSPGARRPGPWIETMRKYEPGEPGGVVDQILGAAADTGRDIIHLATLYLLSPEGQEPGSEPDATWEPSVSHHEEWNQQHRATYEEAIVEPTRITIPAPGLGLGSLGIRAQPIVDEMNRKIAELEAALRRVENIGKFSIA
jgi:hypothetical protein